MSRNGEDTVVFTDNITVTVIEAEVEDVVVAVVAADTDAETVAD